MCAENNLHDPEYIPVSDVGPPHARVFTIRCVVSNFTEDGVGTTKKQAKHDAAKKMVDKINNLIADKQLEDLDRGTITQSSENNEDIRLGEIAKSKYCILRKFTPKKVNLGIKIADYHTVTRDNLDDDARCKIVEELCNLIPNDLKHITEEVIIEKLSKFENLLAEANITLILHDVQCIEGYTKAIKLDTCPPILQVGVGKTELEAVFKVLSCMINTLKSFWS